MSTSEPADRGGTGPEAIDGHTCDDAQVDAKLFVNGVRVPITDIDIRKRKEGPLSYTAYAEGTIISPYDGTDYIRAFRGSSPTSQTDEDVIRIAVKDYTTEIFSDSFIGTVTGIGNSPDGIERSWSFRAEGFGHIFDAIPAGKTFGGDAGFNIDTVVEYIRKELNKRASISLTQSAGVTTETKIQGSKGFLEKARDFILPSTLVKPADPVEPDFTKTFQRNRDTLTDVIRFLEDTFNVYTFIVSIGGEPTLVVTEDPHFMDHKAHYLGGELQIINNDALAELRPVNTLIAKGDAKGSRSGPIGVFERYEGPPLYGKAVARQEQLYERAGQRELVADTIEVDAKERKTIEQKARRQLKESIDSATGGDMQTFLRTPIKPYDVIEAQPTCDETAATTLDPITYEVNRVHHKIRSGKRSGTVLDVGLHTDVQDDVTIAEFGWEEVQ